MPKTRSKKRVNVSVEGKMGVNCGMCCVPTSCCGLAHFLLKLFQFALEYFAFGNAAVLFLIAQTQPPEF